MVFKGVIHIELFSRAVVPTWYLLFSTVYQNQCVGNSVVLDNRWVVSRYQHP